MKKCPNCSAEMLSGYRAKLDNSPFANFILYTKGKTVKIDAYLCPSCGKIEFYTCNSSETNREEDH